VGCGTVTQGFVALSDGSATVRASRTTCGEAMACPPQDATYEVTVRVTG
jgi:hypothetical protein